jgi:hypothetical protein
VVAGRRVASDLTDPDAVVDAVDHHIREVAGSPVLIPVAVLLVIVVSSQCLPSRVGNSHILLGARLALVYVRNGSDPFAFGGSDGPALVLVGELVFHDVLFEAATRSFCGLRSQAIFNRLRGSVNLAKESGSVSYIAD